MFGPQHLPKTHQLRTKGFVLPYLETVDNFQVFNKTCFEDALTLWNRVLPNQLTVSRLVIKFHAFHTTPRSPPQTQIAPFVSVLSQKKQAVARTYNAFKTYSLPPSHAYLKQTLLLPFSEQVMNF
jgi:hypothetical protein